MFSTDENLPASTKKNLCILSDIFPVLKVSICEFQAAPLYPPQFQKSRENKVGKNMWMFCETQEKKWTKKNCETDGGENFAS